MVDRHSGICRAAYFRFAPEADVELEYCHLSRWANSDKKHGTESDAQGTTSTS
jgi:hypothetical protein